MFDGRVGAHVHLLRCVPESNVTVPCFLTIDVGQSERCAHVSPSRCPLDWASSWRKDGFFLLGFWKNALT